MFARSLFARLSRTAVSEVAERLYAEYEAFATRDLSEFDIAYLFIDGVAERLYPGHARTRCCAAGASISTAESTFFR